MKPSGCVLFVVRSSAQASQCPGSRACREPATTALSVTHNQISSSSIALYSDPLLAQVLMA
jgi:hypothetical protein